jgi:oligopeptide transport system permease protein
MSMSEKAANSTAVLTQESAGVRGWSAVWAGLVRSTPGAVGVVMLLVLALACVVTLPWTLGAYTPAGLVWKQMPADQLPARIEYQERSALRLPPTWVAYDAGDRARYDALTKQIAERMEADWLKADAEKVRSGGFVPSADQLAAARPTYVMGTDVLGRDVFARTLAGGAISLGIGLAAATISVLLGTMYGAISGYVGGKVDDVMMRIVDVLYGLPYVLLVVLLAVASDALIEEMTSKSGLRERWIRQEATLVAKERGWAEDARSVSALLDGDAKLRAELESKADAKPELKPTPMSEGARTRWQIATLLVAIGGVSWLTLARVVRGQVLSLKAQPFIESARAIGCPVWRVFFVHLLPNLTGPIVVYATLTVPQAILQESFLSFLGIGVRPPMPSWGNLAADGLSELNTVQSNWWLLVFPCVMLGLTLLALNLMGEALREMLDPRRGRGR